MNNQYPPDAQKAEWVVEIPKLESKALVENEDAKTDQSMNEEIKNTIELQKPVESQRDRKNRLARERRAKRKAYNYGSKGDRLDGYSDAYMD